MEKAWAFYRRSTDKQELSISDQRRDCQEFAARQGWHIVREFEPVKGWGSGLTIDQDPSFKEMVRLAEAADHGIRYLVVYDVSRFGRLQPEDKIYWERRLKKQGGIQVVYVKDDFKNDGSIGDILTKVVKHSEAHQFSMKLSELTLRGAKSHSALGHHAGGKAPYGYDRLLIDATGNPVKVLAKGEWKESKLQRVILKPSPVEKPVVQGIFDAYDKGRGLHLIAEDLNRRSVPSPRGRHWSKTMVHYLLRNRTYLGECIYNKSSYKAYRRGEKGSLKNPKDQWVIKEQAYEPIIDKDLFMRVQAKFKTRPFVKGGSHHRPYLLSGLANCAHCGYKLMGWPKHGNGHTYLTYTCTGYHQRGRAVCRSFNVLSDDLEGTAVQAIRRHLSDPAWRENLKPLLRSAIEDNFGTNVESQIKRLQARLADVNRKIENIVEAVQAGRFSEALSATLQKLEAERNNVRQELAEAESRISESESIEILTEKALALADNFEHIWGKALTHDERKEILRKFIHQVNVEHSPNRIHATYWLYKVPLPSQMLTPRPNGFEAIHPWGQLRG